MKLSEVKKNLEGLERLNFKLPSGEYVPGHFHVTEVGKVNRKFIDCGGSVREEEVVNFQLWNADDYDHRLHPEKLNNIILLAEKTLGLSEDSDVEVEYQGDTIEVYNLLFDGMDFILSSTQTDCLAKDKCGIDSQKPKVKLSDLGKNSCTPGGGCC